MLSYCWRAELPRVNISKESRDLLNHFWFVRWKTYRNTFLLVLSWWPINKTFYIRIVLYEHSTNEIKRFFCVAWLSSFETKHFVKNDFSKTRTVPAKLTQLAKRLGICFVNEHFTFNVDAFQNERTDGWTQNIKILVQVDWTLCSRGKNKPKKCWLVNNRYLRIQKRRCTTSGTSALIINLKSNVFSFFSIFHTIVIPQKWAETMLLIKVSWLDHSLFCPQIHLTSFFKIHWNIFFFSGIKIAPEHKTINNLTFFIFSRFSWRKWINDSTRLA